MNIKIRDANLSDVFSIAQVHVASWLGAYKGIVPDEYLDKISVEKRAAVWEKMIRDLDASKQFVFVAEDDTRIVGFANAGPARKTDFEFDGELYAIYADPKYYGQGVGRPLFKKCVDRLKQNNFSSFYCWVLDDNKRGREFYVRVGGKVIEGEEVIAEMGGQKLKEIMYGWKL